MLHSEQMNQSASEQEWLSCLLDGELDEAEGRGALDRLSADPVLTRRWAEYCLIGDVMRGQADLQPTLRRRVLHALEAEPTVLAPMRRQARLRPLLWVAAAASVAAVTWTIWSALPRNNEAPVGLAQRPDAYIVQASQIAPYLDAHQDFAQGVVAHPEMRFTRLSLASMEGGR